MLSLFLHSLPLAEARMVKAASTPAQQRDVADGCRRIIAGTYNTSLLELTFTPPSTLEVTSVKSTAEAPWNDTAPSWIQPSVHPGLAYVGDEGQAGQAIAFNTSSLEPISAQSTQGFGPAYIGTTDDGKWVLAPNYGDGNFIALDLDPTSGLFAFETQHLIQFEGKGPDATQPQPQPHMALQHPTSGHVFIPDRGTDQVHEIALLDGDTGPQWTLVQNITIEPAGSGPRHMRWNKDGTVAYLLNEITSSLHVYNVDASGDTAKWEIVSRTNILPPGATPVPEAPLAAGEIQITKDGTAIYASNRDDANPEGDAIALFTLDPPFGTQLNGPTFFRSGGVHIRGMELSPEEDLLIAGNMLSGSVAMFSRNAADNTLERVALLQTDGNYRTTTFLWT